MRMAPMPPYPALDPAKPKSRFSRGPVRLPKRSDAPVRPKPSVYRTRPALGPPRRAVCPWLDPAKPKSRL